LSALRNSILIDVKLHESAKLETVTITAKDIEEVLLEKQIYAK